MAKEREQVGGREVVDIHRSLQITPADSAAPASKLSGLGARFVEEEEGNGGGEAGLFIE